MGVRVLLDRCGEAAAVAQPPYADEALRHRKVRARPRALELPRQLHVVCDRHRYRGVSAASPVCVGPHQVKGADADMRPGAGPTDTPDARLQEDQRAQSADGVSLPEPTQLHVRHGRQVIEAASLAQPERPPETGWCEAHVGVRKEEVVAGRQLSSQVEGIALAKPARWQIGDAQHAQPGVVPRDPAKGLRRAVARSVVHGHDLEARDVLAEQGVHGRLHPLGLVARREDDGDAGRPLVVDGRLVRQTNGPPPGDERIQQRRQPRPKGRGS